MLTTKQKRELKSLANTIKIHYQIGKNDISETLIAMLDKALTAHELIKIDVLKACSLPIMEVSFDVANELGAEIVQIVGKSIVLYRRNKDNPKIKI